MDSETTRRTFFGLLSFSPLAWFGGGKKDNTDIRVKRWYDTARLYANDADDWRERCKSAELDVKLATIAIKEAYEHLEAGDDFRAKLTLGYAKNTWMEYQSTEGIEQADAGNTRPLDEVKKELGL